MHHDCLIPEWCSLIALAFAHHTNKANAYHAVVRSVELARDIRPCEIVMGINGLALRLTASADTIAIRMDSDHDFHVKITNKNVIVLKRGYIEILKENWQ